MNQLIENENRDVTKYEAEIETEWKISKWTDYYKAKMKAYSKMNLMKLGLFHATELDKKIRKLQTQYEIETNIGLRLQKLDEVKRKRKERQIKLIHMGKEERAIEMARLSKKQLLKKNSDKKWRHKAQKSLIEMSSKIKIPSTFD